MSLLGVIFDFDGVIADTERLHLRAFQQVLSGGPLTLTEEAYDARYLGYDDAGVFTAVAADHGRRLAPGELARLIAAKGRRYDDLVGAGQVVFPDAPRCIERLAADAILGIASGALHGEIEAILVGAGLRGRFSAIVAADDVERSKPAPDSYARAVELLCAELGRPPSPSGFVAIEDSRWGIEAAAAAGLPCVGVTTSYGPQDLPGAALVVPRLAELDREALAALCRS
ncbi:MAG: HAD-IA family hydrolase [Acidobacteria bacterium]|nr:HAD-IA family hydrolase [Acidobacteriota bacterium]